MSLLHRLLPLRLCTLVLMGSLLVGVQLLQASPLHEHAGHALHDCSIGHLPTTDTPPTQLPLPITRVLLLRDCPADCAQYSTRRRHSPYQGRAPPPQSA